MSSSTPVSQENVKKYRELGYNIGYYRKRMGLTQEKLAEKIGISRSHLSAIEAPNVLRPFSIELLFRIAAAMDVDPHKLLVFRE